MAWVITTGQNLRPHTHAHPLSVIGLLQPLHLFLTGGAVSRSETPTHPLTCLCNILSDADGVILRGSRHGERQTFFFWIMARLKACQVDLKNLLPQIITPLNQERRERVDERVWSLLLCLTGSPPPLRHINTDSHRHNTPHKHTGISALSLCYWL